MNMKNGKRIVAATLAIIAILALGQSAHAQSITERYDRASYIPGDSGTLTVSVINNSPTDTVEIRNVTIYFPWAGLVDGKWQSGANASINLAQWKTLGSAGSGSNVYTASFGFSVPTWYGGPLSSLGGNCPNSPQVRYGIYSSCVIVGITANPPRYETDGFSIIMAGATYTPASLTALWLPIATLVVLIVATAFLAMAWMSLRKTAKKA